MDEPGILCLSGGSVASMSLRSTATAMASNVYQSLMTEESMASMLINHIGGGIDSGSIGSP